MFHSPFGSIFSSDTHRGLGYLGNQSKAQPKEQTQPKDQVGPGKLEAEKEVVSKNKAKPAPKVQQKPEAAQKPKATSISAKREALKKKKPFDETLPQFRAATTMRSDNPKVKAEHSKILVEKAKQKLRAIKRRLKEIKTKIDSAKVYRDVLAIYSQLKGQDKAALDEWIGQHNEAIKKLSAARNLKKTAKDNREAAAAIDAEIKHWEALKALKESGVDIKGKTILKNYRPSKKSIPASPEPKGQIPKFKAEVPTEQIVRLKQKSSSATELRGLEATDEAEKSIDKMKPKKTYKEIFVEQLPGRDFYVEKREVKKQGSKLQKKIEKTIVRSKELEWRADRAKDELDKALAEYKKVQEDLSDFVDSLSSDPQSSRAVNALGVLLEARPERFLSAPTLLQASKNSFKRLSNLGEETAQEAITQEEATPEKEADALLQEAAADSTASLRELEAKQNALAQLKAEVEGTSPPPPIDISVEIVQPAPQETTGSKAAKFINKVLPWIAGIYLLKRIMED